MFMVMFMSKKTTVSLREDVYQALKEKAGARNVSALINKILVEYFAKKESMFGVMRKVDLQDLRDHRDRLCDT
jgi:predicted CopG family antitoxin